MDELAMALGELAASAEGFDRHANDQLVPPGERRCPICGEKMAVILKYGIDIDVCEKHGIWLDQGELAAMLQRSYIQQRDNEYVAKDRSSIQAATNRQLENGVKRAAILH